MLNTLNECRDGESSQQRLLSPARVRGSGSVVQGATQAKEEAGSKGTGQISSVSHRHSAEPALPTEGPLSIAGIMPGPSSSGVWQRKALLVFI